MVRIHDAQTDQIVDREMTTVEFKQYEKDQKETLNRKAEADAKALAKQVILDRIGLTADELKTILG